MAKNPRKLALDIIPAEVSGWPLCLCVRVSVCVCLHVCLHVCVCVCPLLAYASSACPCACHATVVPVQGGRRSHQAPVYVRALFDYNADEDAWMPCVNGGTSFAKGDILEVFALTIMERQSVCARVCVRACVCVRVCVCVCVRACEAVRALLVFASALALGLVRQRDARKHAHPPLR